MGLDNKTCEPLTMTFEEYIAIIYVMNLYLAGMDEIAL